jgi:transcription-repair coupling factor (superfamily II helicase)
VELSAGADAPTIDAEPVDSIGEVRMAFLSIGEAAVALAEAVARGDVLFIASDEQRAEAVAAALAAAVPDAAVIHCPSSDALPGDTAPASPANVGRRVAALRRLRRLLGSDEARPSIALISTAEAAARLYPAPVAFEAAPPTLTIGNSLDVERFVEEMTALGYITDDRVDEPGEIAARGQVIDIFPADAGLPVRIEMADGQIVALRAYDPASQRGLDELDMLEIGRVDEPGDPATTSLFEHLPGSPVLLDPDALARAERFVALIGDARRGADQARLPVPCDAGAWAALLKGRERLTPVAGEPVPRFAEERSPLRAFARLAKAHRETGGRIVLAGGMRDLRFLGRRVGKSLGIAVEPLASWQAAHALAPGAVATFAMPIDRGWRADDLLVVAAADLLGSRAASGAAIAAQADPFAGAGEIHVGDLIVHEDHGIGIVAGLEATPLGGDQAETNGGDAITLDYAAGGRRLVPVDEADRIWRYGADADAVSLDRLDGASWQKRRIAIDQAIAESARSLTAMAAARAGRRIAPIVPPSAAYERFSATFPFTETPDQARAIAAVRDDLAAETPMDRLVIGDVGYGKTEVALRGAALAAFAGRQVAIAAPTTVLVRQHIDSFTRRFAGTGIVVAGLSRLSSAAEKKAVKAGLADGSIAIVIGTGAVAARDVTYQDLGLVVIDEEQRFGAADKERLRTMGDANILSLSATPIPRTLQAALIGLQQLSVIATPPARRQPIRTSLGEYDPQVVRTALLREKGRGGQSFVVISRIEDMAPMAERLAKLVPELRLVAAHGKMKPLDIDAAMVAFAAGDGDVLLATNIIEAGLDVPRANTMIVWRADRFGLSQLHQLRGRVGRGGRRGQVLLLTDADHPIAEATIKRLRTLQAFDRLGAGFAISARDLDMRGAGDLLGETQSGHMKLIGIDLYQHLLGGALRAARGEHIERWNPELTLGLAGRLPESWIPDTDVRVVLYGRLARIEDGATLDAFADELEDRFGALPDEAALLLDIAAIRLLARDLGIARIISGPAAIALEPRDPLPAAGAAGLVEKKGRWLLQEAIDDPLARLARLRALLELLAEGLSS